MYSKSQKVRKQETAAQFLARHRGAGRPLDSETRLFMESRFGHDFSKVRIYADREAAQSAEGFGASAYTTGFDIVFGADAFSRQRLAHELTHVVQQSRAGVSSTTSTEAEARTNASRVAAGLPGNVQAAATLGTVQRDEPDHKKADESTASVPGPDLEQLLQQIDERTSQNLQLRQQLDALPPMSSSERDALSKQLDAGRTELIGLLQRRIIQLKEAIGEEEHAFETPTMSGEPDEAVGQRTFFNRNRYMRQLKEHENQLKVLQRWQSKQKIAEIDVEVAQAGTSEERKTELKANRKTLVQSMLASAVEYKQGDQRWGDVEYGGPGFTKMKAAGCGPTSLAIAMNYVYAQDPESARTGPTEFINPMETEKYAEKHGRVKGQGTSHRMFSDLATQFPQCSAKKVSLDEAIAALRSAKLVVIHCSPCKGTKKDGTTTTYTGHYMVLNGVDEKGTTFNVLDPGRKESLDIETMARSQVASATGLFVVEQK